MLDVIARHHPADIHQPLVALKEATWRLMHSYVHGGIRPVVQSFVAFPHHEAGSLLINANGMLLMATNAVRMAHALPSPMLATLQQQFADCLPKKLTLPRSFLNLFPVAPKIRQIGNAPGR